MQHLIRMVALAQVIDLQILAFQHTGHFYAARAWQRWWRGGTLVEGLDRARRASFAVAIFAPSELVDFQKHNCDHALLLGASLAAGGRALVCRHPQGPAVVDVSPEECLFDTVDGLGRHVTSWLDRVTAPNLAG